MAKKKEIAVDAMAPNEVQNTGVLNPQVEAPVRVLPMAADVVIAEVDFNELLELEKATRQTEEQFNKIAGNIERLKYDLTLYHNHEKSLNEQINLKRKELVKRYQIDDQRQWRIDVNSRKVVYQA